MSRERSWLRAKAGLSSGLKAGLRGFVWMAEIIVPVSLGVAFLQWTGWLDAMSRLFAPAMGFLKLPPEAALPILTGMLVNIYAVLAAVTVLPLSVPQITLIAIFSLIAHNFIMEGIVQHRSGINVFKITAVRLAAALLTVFLVSRLLGTASTSLNVQTWSSGQVPLISAFEDWVRNTAWLLLKVLIIIVAIMIVLEASKALGWMRFVLNIFRPVMSVFGLSERTTMMFVTGIVFGLLYGGATIVREAKAGLITRLDAEKLHVSLSINHSIVEDPALFAALGVNLLWLWVPRLIVAILAVHLFSAVSVLWRKHRRASSAQA